MLGLLLLLPNKQASCFENKMDDSFSLLHASLYIYYNDEQTLMLMFAVPPGTFCFSQSGWMKVGAVAHIMDSSTKSPRCVSLSRKR